jgi:hypothetical protein
MLASAERRMYSVDSLYDIALAIKTYTCPVDDKKIETCRSINKLHVKMYFQYLWIYWCSFKMLCRTGFGKKRSDKWQERGRDSSVDVATGYGLDGPGIEKKSRWDKIFRTRPDRLWGPPSLLFNGYRVFTGGKSAGAWCWPHTPF